MNESKKPELVNAMVDGFKDSFRLSAGIVIAVASTVSAFSNHALGNKKRSGWKKCDDQPPVAFPYHKAR